MVDVHNVKVDPAADRQGTCTGFMKGYKDAATNY